VIRSLLINVTIMLASSASLSVAADNLGAGACSRVQPESRAESDLSAGSPGVGPAFVPPERLSRMSAGARLVDMRRQSTHSRWRPEGAAALSFLELRVLAGRAQEPVLVFGNGYDDSRIARRIARWNSSEAERVRVVRFGAAGIALSHSGSSTESELKELIAIPARKIVSVGKRPGGLVAWFGSSGVPSSIQASLPRVRDAGLQSATEVADWVGDQASEDGATIVLVGDDSVRVADAAFDASVALGRPIFYINGSLSQISRQIDRHARLVQGRRRVGDVPCG